jgi:acyl-CoA synthetase (AMP-forming)/AMP-acid ligase II
MGIPKGVMVEHKNLSNTIAAPQSSFDFSSIEIFPCLASFSFDIFLFELFNPLVNGSICLLLSKQQILDSNYLLKVLQQVSAIHTVPSLMRQILSFIAEEPSSEIESLEKIFIGGDAVPIELLEQMSKLFPKAEIEVLYGPTEATIISTSHRYSISQKASQIIGRPLGNVKLRVCDDQGRLLPIGAPGEILIGGEGVVRGYLNRPELTAERFIADQFSKEGNGRVYKTGDIGRYLPDGEIEYLGRKDHQVKIRGYRIELGEIEAVLLEHEGVREAVVAAREEEAGDKRLVAYLVAETEQYALTSSQLRSYLKERLPDYMIPASFVMLERMPLTPNGKIDRRSLPEPKGSRPDLEKGFVAPSNHIEEKLARIWSDLLGVAQVGIHDNFFYLGGHSLVATQLISRIQKSFHLKLPLRYLFDKPTIAELAVLISQTLGDQSTPQTIPIKRIDQLDDDQLLATIDQLSDSAVVSLLNDLLAEDCEEETN